MFRWMPFAMVRVTAFFAGGIVLACYYPERIESGFILIALAVFLALYLICVRLRLRRSWTGSIGLIAVCMIGYVHVQLQTVRNDSRHFIHEAQVITHYQARVTRYAEEKQNSWKCEAEVLRVRTTNGWTFRTGNVLLYLAKADFPTPFSYGDVLLIRGGPQIVKGPSNPGEFDLRKLLSFRNTYHQHYIRRDNARSIGHDPGSWIISSAIAVRLWADRQLKTYVHGSQEQATASALVLGVTDGLDNDLLKAYSATGAMHVLAVSGLHVSIIYWIILLIGKPLEKLTYGRPLLAVISVVLLWIYAFVTGWSPSVLRAVMMFTFVALARPWRQSTNIYNTMASSAFCLLIYDPFFLMSVGFQLSYIAVLGIVFLHPYLYRLWEPESRIWDEIWKVTSVSIAAQLATFPISLLYFHQFPNYFLLANLLVIPASTVVLIAGIALLPLSLVPVLASAVGFVLHWSIWLMNSIVVWIGELPFSLTESIYINGLQTIILSAIVLCIALCFILKRLRWMWYAAGLVVVFSIIDWMHLFQVVDRSHIIVYSVRGHTALDLVRGGRLTSYIDQSLLMDTRSIDFHISPARVPLGVRSPGEKASIISRAGCDYIYWEGKTIIVVKSRNFRLPRDASADLVVISNRSVSDIGRLTSRVRCANIIIDSSNSLYFADMLLRQASDGIRLYSVPHHGAFQLSL